MFGLGYSLLVFVYDKIDDAPSRTAVLEMKHVIFVPKEFTVDFQTTRGLRDILAGEGNRDGLLAFLSDRHLPVDEIGLAQIVDQVLESPPKQGYLTISNALQRRLQYGRAIVQAGSVPEILRVL